MPLPPGLDPADVVQREGADGDARAARPAVPFARFGVERAIERGDTRSAEGRDRVLDEVVPVIAPLPASVLREELVQLVAGRLSVTESLVASALADPARMARAEAARREAALRESRRPSVASGARGAAAVPRSPDAGDRGADPGPQEWSPPADYDDPGPEQGRHDGGAGPVNGARRVLDRREQTERAFLAYCLALPDEGERRLADVDLDDLFASPATRQVAEYLRGRLRTPAADLPRGDEPLARLVAELVIRAGELEATPAKLELEALQLDLSRLDRLIAGARVSGGEGMRDLAAERQQVLDAIRHRLT